MNIYAYDQFYFMKITKFVKKTKFEKCIIRSPNQKIEK